MPEFTARVGSAGGDIFEKSFLSVSAQALRSELEEKGFHVFSIRQPGLALRLKNFIPFLSRRVGTEEFLLFNQQLAALLKAGVPLLTALEALCERRKKGHFGHLLREIADEVRGGTALSAAFAARQEFFPSIYPATLASGEQSGELATVVARYVKYAKAGHKLRRRVISAFIYPAFILTIGGIASLVVVTFVLPKFMDLFAETGGDLPALTRGVIALSDFLRFRWYLIPGIIAGLFFLINRARRSPRISALIGRLSLRVPLFGSLMRKYGLAQYARTLSTLLAGGIPLADANLISGRALSNRYLSAKLVTITDALREGKSFWESMTATGISTDLAIEMIKVGEASGSLTAMLAEVSEYYDGELDESVTRLLSVLEPLLLVLTAVMIAILLIAIYLPMVSGVSQIQ